MAHTRRIALGEEKWQTHTHTHTHARMLLEERNDTYTHTHTQECSWRRGMTHTTLIAPRGEHHPDSTRGEHHPDRTQRGTQEYSRNDTHHPDRTQRGMAHLHTHARIL